MTSLDPRRTLRACIAISLVLFALHTVTRWLYDRYGTGGIDILNLGKDSAIPTWFAALLLGSTGLIFALVWRDVEREGNRREALRWAGLAAIFIAMSVDEVAAIHEWAGEQISLDQRGGFLTYDWIVLGAPLVVIVGLAYLRFVLGFEPRARMLFFVGAAFFVGGGLVIEAFNSALTGSGRQDTFRYGFQTGVEELFEFVGASMFLAAAMTIAAGRAVVLHVGFSTGAAEHPGRTQVTDGAEAGS